MVTNTYKLHILCDLYFSQKKYESKLYKMNLIMYSV